LAATALAVPNASAAVEATDGCIASVPEPGGSEPVEICYTLFRPEGADAGHPVPLVFHSHGWGGSRTTDPASFEEWTTNGFGVLSFDQRGFGASGGKAHVEHPDFEGQDVQRLVDVVAGLDWVAKEAPGDPLIGAIGGSYGGGYQFVGAFTELRDRGATRFDVLAPEITWWDLKESLAPQEVVRSLWVSALYAAGTDAHTDTVNRGFVYGAATGNWSNGEVVPDSDLTAFFQKNGPAWHVSQGRKLDIPVLFGQGITDNLFNLNQGLKNYDNALTPSARARSIFVGYNGGHVLPSTVPPGTDGVGDPCSEQLGGGSFGDLARRFFRENLKHEPTGLAGQGLYHLATPEGACVTSATAAASKDVAVGQVASTVGQGVPIATKVADGPITIAGTPEVVAKVTTMSPDARVFFALSVGTSPLDARIVQNNMLPLREVDPVAAEPRTIELPAVAVEVPEGQSLFLTVSPVSDMSFGHGSRVPGAILLDDTVVRLPLPTATPTSVLGVNVERAAPAPAAATGGQSTLPATGGETWAAAIGGVLLAVCMLLRRAPVLRR
jgi:pimeloyl-ACP methyl ester carboxylesterase